jgi:hypothetical protein
MTVEVGTLYRWRSDALGVAAGTLGVCYSELGETCAGVLFDTGVPCALTDVELNRYAEHLGYAQEMAIYRFEDLGRLLDDFSRGRFAGVFRHAEAAARAVA